MNKKILLVDDDHDLIEMYQPYLKQHGYNVKAAYNSEEAKTIFQEFDPDIIFCDLGTVHFDSGFGALPLDEPPAGARETLGRGLYINGP
ncbi:MAG: response regulator [Candidatus Marinimicrobia bacterium]|nr:response regulator [Candidatus Neomarinimicrobiota bacterium]